MQLQKEEQIYFYSKKKIVWLTAMNWWVDKMHQFRAAANEFLKLLLMNPFVN